MSHASHRAIDYTGRKVNLDGDTRPWIVVAQYFLSGHAVADVVAMRGGSTEKLCAVLVARITEPGG